MKVGFLSESPADEGALRILVNGLLGSETVLIEKPSLRSRGWPSVKQIAPTVIRYLHYRTDADALVLVVDSNASKAHETDDNGCRLCTLHRDVRQVIADLQIRGDGTKVKVAVGIAIPAVEAWYLCGTNPSLSEAAWNAGLQGGSLPYTVRSLKREVYGTERPSLELESRRAKEEASRLIRNLNLLKSKFPFGFGSFAREIEIWRSRRPEHASS